MPRANHTAWSRRTQFICNLKLVVGDFPVLDPNLGYANNVRTLDETIAL